MTEEKKSYRIAKVASELGVGVQTIAEELNKQGFSVDAKPTSKLTEDMYQLLQKAFKSDKAARDEAVLLERNKKEIAEPVKTGKATRKEENTEPEEEPVVIINSPTITKETEAKKEEKPAAKEKEPVAVPEIKEEKTPEPVAEKTPEPEVKTKKEEQPETEPTAQVLDRKVKLSGTKVVNKIDLESLNTKSRPDTKKGKKETPKTTEEKPVAKEKEPVVPEVKEEKTPEVKADEKTSAPPKVTAKEKEDISEEAPVTENQEIRKPRTEKLQGLTVLGKINLPAGESRKKPVASSDANDKGKKKRKRKITGTTPISSDNPNLTRQFSRDSRPGGPGGNNTGTGNTGSGNTNRGGSNNPGRGRFVREEAKEISQKEIQDKLKQTLARLNPGGKPGSSGSQRYKNRKQKRDIHAQNREDALQEQERDKRILKVTEFVTANELAKLMDVSVNQVITTCFAMGMMVSINQRLDAETITIVADEFGFDVQFVGAELQDAIEEEADSPEDLKQRAPIVTVMGHVDHGKTSLLDYIRDANIVAGEAGGITQHIGAYEVTLKSGRQITFLDTPGHEAFTAMRARGAKLTDIAIIVIAADDSVMPQTKEAISHSQAANVPMVFAFNKIDRDGANADRIREQLAAMNILVEEWGGKHQTQEISAKKGLNIDLLLDKVLLEADILDLKANPDKRAKGTVIEARLDKGRGIVTTLMVQDGTLQIGDTMVAGANYARVKAMFNERGQRMEKAGPSAPVSVLGFNATPQAGENFNVMATEAEAKDIATKRAQLLREQGLRTRKHITLDEIGRRLAIGNFKELNVIVKADVDGSAEALSDSLLKLSTPEVQVNVILKGVGQISESDVLLATASDAIIVGFQVRPSAQAKKLAEQEDIEIKLYSIIYSAIEEIKAAMEGMLEPTMEEKIVCNVEVRDVFRITKVGTVAGCMVTEGKITRNTRVRIIRDGVVIHTGEIDALKRFKDDVREVATGYECGISIKNFNDIQVGDIIEGFEEVEVKRKL